MDVLSAVRCELREQVDAKTRDSYTRVFKEKITFYGVNNAIVDKIASKYFQEIKKLDKKLIFSLCEELLKSDYSEEAFIAFAWSHRLNNNFKPEDFAVFESWLIKYVNNWAKCDTLCNHTIGDFLMLYPRYIKNLKDWTRSPNRWLRRAAAVSLVLPARRGYFLLDVFDIADNLLRDKDDLVQKGYGWMLKEASRLNQSEVFEYVMRNRSVMPRTALRYAIEKMPPELRLLAMAREK